MSNIGGGLAGLPRGLSSLLEPVDFILGWDAAPKHPISSGSRVTQESASESPVPGAAKNDPLSGYSGGSFRGLGDRCSLLAVMKNPH